MQCQFRLQIDLVGDHMKQANRKFDIVTSRSVNGVAKGANTAMFTDDAHHRMKAQSKSTAPRKTDKDITSNRRGNVSPRSVTPITSGGIGMPAIASKSSKAPVSSWTAACDMTAVTAEFPTDGTPTMPNALHSKKVGQWLKIIGAVGVLLALTLMVWNIADPVALRDLKPKVLTASASVFLVVLALYIGWLSRKIPPQHK